MGMVIASAVHDASAPHAGRTSGCSRFGCSGGLLTGAADAARQSALAQNHRSRKEAVGDAIAERAVVVDHAGAQLVSMV